MGVERSDGFRNRSIDPIVDVGDVDAGVEVEIEAPLIPPNTVRGSLEAVAHVADRPRVVGPGSITSADEAAAKITKLLSFGVLDFAVTDREARRAVDAFHQLPADAIGPAVDRIDPKLLTRLENNVPSRVRDAHEETIAAIRTARNQPSGEVIDVDDLINDLRRDLDGFLALDLVTENSARSAIDRFRRLGAEDRTRVLDALGPSKSYRMIANLSDTDAKVYGPTIDLIRGSFFGHMRSVCEARGLAPEPRTTSFEATLKDVAAGRHEAPVDLNDFVYFLVPGLVTEYQPGYMDQNEARLRKMGVEVSRSQIDTDADVETNAAQIREEIKELAARSRKKVVLISHSKGGPDSAEALQDETTEALVHRFIPMQPACATPVASTLMDSPFGSAIRGTFENVLGATNGEALADLGFLPAKKRFERSRELTVPVLSLASTVGGHFSALRAVADLMKSRYGVDSDGLVTLPEQFVPSQNAFQIILDDVDHAAPVAAQIPGMPAPKHDPGDLTEALVSMALRL